LALAAGAAAEDYAKTVVAADISRRRARADDRHRREGAAAISSPRAIETSVAEGPRPELGAALPS